MTVALGSKGNNFILGGKTQYLSAEDAYTVRVSSFRAREPHFHTSA